MNSSEVREEWAQAPRKDQLFGADKWYSSIFTCSTQILKADLVRGGNTKTGPYPTVEIRETLR